MHANAKATLGGWRDLFETSSVVAGSAEQEQFKDLFGSTPQLTLIRPDGYVGFVGGEHSVGELGKYMERWFPHSANTSEATHA